MFEFNSLQYFSNIPNNSEHQSVSTEEDSQEFDAREEPDGEETATRNVQTIAQQPSPSFASVPKCDTVKVPNWVLSDSTLEVVFNERATKQIDEFQINRVRDFSYAY